MSPPITTSVGKKSTIATMIKKRLSIESTGNRLACHTVGSMSSAVDQRVIKERGHALDEQLRSKQLTTRDVVGGHEERHSVLRTGITNHMLSEVAANSLPDGTDILKYINSISRDCVRVGANVVLALQTIYDLLYMYISRPVTLYPKSILHVWRCLLSLHTELLPINHTILEWSTTIMQVFIHYSLMSES